MGFDIAKTPTVEAVATADAQALAEDLKKRVAEALAAVEERAEVAEAVERHKTAQDRLEKLRVAQRVLNGHAKDARERLARASDATIDGLVDSSAAKGKPDFGKLGELAGIELQTRYATRALEQIAEHKIPLAQIVSLRAESHALEAKARALRQVAQERAEIVLRRMREAVSEEMVLPVDLSKGVAGALIERADGLRRRAVQMSEAADEMERAYADRRAASQEVVKEGR